MQTVEKWFIRYKQHLTGVPGRIVGFGLFLVILFTLLPIGPAGNSNSNNDTTSSSLPNSPFQAGQLKVEKAQGPPQASSSAGLQGEPPQLQGAPAPQGPPASGDLQATTQNSLQPTKPGLNND